MMWTDNSTDTQEPRPPVRPSSRSAEYGELQRLIDAIYSVNPSGTRTKIEILTRAEIDDLGHELMEVIEQLPGGSYKRYRLCDQLNSIITAHGWAHIYGTVE